MVRTSPRQARRGRPRRARSSTRRAPGPRRTRSAPPASPRWRGRARRAHPLRHPRRARPRPRAVRRASAPWSSGPGTPRPTASSRSPSSPTGDPAHDDHLGDPRRRASTRVFGGGDGDALPARGQLGAELRRLVDAGPLELSRRVSASSGPRARRPARGRRARRAGEPFVHDGIDAIVAATGQRPGPRASLRELRLDLDPALECAASARPADRSERAQLRHGPPARRSRARPPRARLLRRSAARATAARRRSCSPPATSRPARSSAMLAGDVAGRRARRARPPETGVCSSRSSRRTRCGCCPPARRYRPSLKRVRLAGSSVLGLSADQLVAWGALYYAYAVLSGPSPRARAPASSVAPRVLGGPAGRAGSPPAVGRTFDAGHPQVTGAGALLGASLSLVLLRARGEPESLLAAFAAAGHRPGAVPLRGRVSHGRRVVPGGARRGRVPCSWSRASPGSRAPCSSR